MNIKPLKPNASQTTIDPDDPLQQQWTKDVKEAIGRFSKRLHDSTDDLDQTPQHYQDLIQNIDGLSPEEQMRLIDTHVNGSIKPVVQDADGIDPLCNFPEAANSPEGDCDNFASAKFGMLANSDIPPEDFSFAAGTINYEAISNGDKAFEEPVGHTFCLVRIDGEVYLMDNNLKEPIKIDQNGEGVGTLSFEHDGQHHEVPVNFKIHELYYEINGVDSSKPIFYTEIPIPDAVRQNMKNEMNLNQSEDHTATHEQSTPTMSA